MSPLSLRDPEMDRALNERSLVAVIEKMHWQWVGDTWPVPWQHDIVVEHSASAGDVADRHAYEIMKRFEDLTGRDGRIRLADMHRALVLDLIQDLGFGVDYEEWPEIVVGIDAMPIFDHEGNQLL